jgi:ketosteroid isomerase-like protein
MVTAMHEPGIDGDDGLSVMRSWFETWNRGDLEAFVALYATDAEMSPPASWVETGTISGQAAIGRFFAGLREAWEGHDSAEMLELFFAGEEVVSRMEWRVRGRASGIDTHLELTNISTIVDGRIVRQRHYLEYDEALRALA